MLDFYDIVYVVVLFVSMTFIIFWLMVSLEATFSGKKRKAPKELTSFPLVTIALPAYNEEENVVKTIKSVFELDYPEDKIELMIMDDGSKDNTKKAAEEFIKREEYKDRNARVYSGKNKGKGAVMNIALKKANGDFFVVFDADSTIEPGALRKMLPEFADEEVAAVLPVLKVRDPKRIIEKFQWIEYLATFFYKQAMGFLDAIPVVPGPFSTYRIGVLRKVGGFDENNLVEDLELALRLQKNHYRITQLLNVVAFTAAPDNLIKFYHQRNRWYKGGFINSLKYRHMMFNRNYGDFGMMEFPSFLSAGIMIALLFITGLIQLIQKIIQSVQNWSSINFDFWTLFQSFEFHWFSFSYGMILLSIFAISWATLLLKWAHESHNEKLFKYGWIILPVYMIIYGLFVMAVWIGVLLDYVFKRRQKW
jgi:cellulose synthase/poly-beta-1,6-N-acetylglucosamine synthase-like glycosyltransferase